MDRLNEKDLEMVTGGSGIDVSKVEYGIMHLQNAAGMCTAEIPEIVKNYITGLVEYLQGMGKDFRMETVRRVMSMANDELDAVIDAGAGVELKELVYAIKGELLSAYYELDF